MGQAVMATVIARFSDQKFKKAFETYLQAAMSGRISAGMMNRYTMTLLSG